MRDDPAVIDLVVRARDGDAAAWDDIVERYAALVWSVCRRHRLDPVDSEDVGGSVWLRLVETLGKLREPAALPGWLVTTTQRECLRLLSTKQRQVPDDDPELGGGPAAGFDEGLLVEERHHALRLAFAALPERCQRLLSMLFRDPPMPYAEISATLEIPIGAIGPDRGRCLDRMRRSGAVVAIAPAGRSGDGSEVTG
jgi:RNA polymerase sigma factor (sigma-70 family)